MRGRAVALVAVSWEAEVVVAVASMVEVVMVEVVIAAEAAMVEVVMVVAGWDAAKAVAETRVETAAVKVVAVTAKATPHMARAPLLSSSLSTLCSR